MFYVLDWTDQDAEVDHPEHDVELDIYNYLNIQNPIIEMDNETVAQIKYNASREITWKVTSAYTIDNSGVSASTKDVTINHDTNFSDDKKGTLTFIRTIGTNEYAPTYITLNVWLDFDDDDNVDANEAEFLREVKITQYPMLYVIRDVSCLRSVYVNGMRGTGNISNYNLGNNSNYPLGYYQGIRNNDYKTTNYSMFIISVSSFNSNDTFEAPLINNDGCLNVAEGNRNSNPNPQVKTYKYVIGDPRVRESEVNLDGEAVSGLWAEGEALYPENSGTRRLQNYYPTESFGNSFQVVAPKFRIVSFNNASGKECTAKSAAMRCASVQEDGYPAGRWRLPTVAEIQYIIKLQKAGAIQEIFTTTTNSISCYATASYGNTNKTHRITMSLIGNDVRWNNIQNEISVRCVYDDWFWGSNRDAKTNPQANNTDNDGDEYLFTWGDMPISWN
jgi:hypothetical protein